MQTGGHGKLLYTTTKSKFPSKASKKQIVTKLIHKYDPFNINTRTPQKHTTPKTNIKHQQQTHKHIQRYATLTHPPTLLLLHHTCCFFTSFSQLLRYILVFYASFSKCTYNSHNTTHNLLLQLSLVVIVDCQRNSHTMEKTPLSQAKGLTKQRTSHSKVTIGGLRASKTRSLDNNTSGHSGKNSQLQSFASTSRVLKAHTIDINKRLAISEAKRRKHQEASSSYSLPQLHAPTRCPKQ